MLPNHPMLLNEHIEVVTPQNYFDIQTTLRYRGVGYDYHFYSCYQIPLNSSDAIPLFLAVLSPSSPLINDCFNLTFLATF